MANPILTTSLSGLELFNQDQYSILFPIAQKYLLEDLSESRFWSLLNLNLKEGIVNLKQGRKRWLYYFVDKVSSNLFISSKSNKLWITDFISYFGLQYDDYKKQRGTMTKMEDINEIFINFQEELDCALENCKNSNFKNKIETMKIYKEIYDKIEFFYEIKKSVKL